MFIKYIIEITVNASMIYIENFIKFISPKTYVKIPVDKNVSRIEFSCLNFHFVVIADAIIIRIMANSIAIIIFYFSFYFLHY